MLDIEKINKCNENKQSQIGRVGVGKKTPTAVDNTRRDQKVRGQVFAGKTLVYISGLLSPQEGTNAV